MAEVFDINIRHLRGLLAIRDHGSITAAGSLVNLSQPALTQGIAKLERQFGYTLFERRSGGMVPTAMGRIVIERTEAALKHLAESAQGLTNVFNNPERLMTMTQLRAFLALADAGSFAEAARTIAISQTAVHRAVGDLEMVIGTELVERRGRAVWLNAAGKKLARGARLAVAEIQAALVDLALDSDSRSEMISFGALPLARPFIVPRAMADIAREVPKASFKVLEGNWSELVEPLRDGAIDMIVGALRPHEIADLYQRPLLDDMLVVAAGSQHPLASVERPTMDQLRSYPWIVAPANSPLRNHWEKFFAEGPRPETQIECGSVMIIGRLLTYANLLTLLSPDQVALQIRSGLLTQIGKPLEGSRRMVGIATRRSWRPTATQRLFLAKLEDAARERISNAALTGTWI
ncbi:DNA-binding transcriptional LysR family regulator [Altererythrobacter atlanticus]|uniref:HTH-type transcriptional activator CmpR n=1 Tax=Croceibacterium atlanticum TaxID=1267766 RepID=A0A0F7KXE4_9SPHN|nr:LysR family transcriptional regulator [Croceibacterium atlanticum]AKH44354.1 HTH-type transcriptional activator CmpR [Croceibacterium atlanticum]MBB5733929.1 DNA-binding transcriptional LysR family regulator [Croceibacterium atlanticum]